MPYKDVSKQKQYQKEWARRARCKPLQTNSTALTGGKVELTYPVRTLEDLRDILQIIVNRVLKADIDEATRGKTLNALIATGIKLVEATHIEKRVAELEQRIEAGEEVSTFA